MKKLIVKRLGNKHLYRALFGLIIATLGTLLRDGLSRHHDELLQTVTGGIPLHSP